ncbi:MAG TPA: KR domain-containing protein, partial [Thermoanaerobaculia bacterium]|nr:KR domain-containing protein [Thermoanaerobaculia bacterium]
MPAKSRLANDSSVQSKRCADLMQIEQLLREIYEALSRDRLSQAEALEKIEAIKLQERTASTGVFLAAPIWRAGGSGEGASLDAGSLQHDVMLCDRPAADAEELSASLPGARCTSLHSEQQDLAQRYSLVAVACFERIQALLRSNSRGKILVQVVVTDDAERALVAGVSGLLRTAALENPRLIVQLILVPAEMSTEELAGRLETEKSRDVNPLVRYQNGARQILDWQEVADDPDTPPAAFKDSGVYLITGGMGGLGILFAREILARTAQATVVLTGRSEESAETRARIDTSFAAPGRVTYRQVDLGDPDQVRRLITSVQ